MPDVRYVQTANLPQYAVRLDWLMSPLHLLEEDLALASAAIVALGTDRLAGPTEILPALGDTDRRGWWGDLDAEEIWGGWPVGSRLWLLSRAKITGALSIEGGTVARADAYAREAMRPFTDNRIASKVSVAAARTATSRIDVDIVIYRGPEPEIDLRYSDLWTELGAV
jgi:phage gp46-like protein